MKQIVLIALLCFCYENAFTQVIEKDSLALVNIYQSLDGENWFNDSNWLSDKPVSEWHGVYIDSNRVTGLFFSNNNLKGSLPNSIGELDSLEVLSIDNEPQLTGPIPSEISRCGNLEDLSIIVTGISGSIPTSLGSMPNLREIQLYRNNLEGEFPIFLLDLSLEQLDISSNNFTGSIPSQIAKLDKIRYLAVGDNMFSGQIPPEISQMKNLRELHLRENEFEGDVELWLKDLPQLYYISLSNNNFTGSIKAEMFNPDSIQFVDFQFSNINYLEDLSSLPLLKRVSCGGTKINFSDLDRNQSIIQLFSLFDLQKRLSKDTVKVKSGEEVIIMSDVDGMNTEYKWYKFNEEIPGETLENLTITDIKEADTGWYYGEGLNYGISAKRESVYLLVDNNTSNVDVVKTNIKVYPNPTSEGVTVEGIQNLVSYRLYNSTGQLIKEDRIRNGHIIDTSMLEAGNYLLKIKEGDQTKVCHLVKI